MKKLLLIFLTAVLVIQSFAVSAASAEGNFDLVEGLGFVPDGFYAKNMAGAATREELAFMMAKLYSLDEQSPVQTKFEDVDPESIYSGYIAKLNAAGVINGESETIFNPAGSFTIGIADILVMRTFGFSEIAKTEAESVNFAVRMGLHKGVSLLDNSVVTRGGLLQFMQNVLEADLPEVAIKGNDEFSAEYTMDNGRTVLGDWLGVSVYDGVLTSVDDEKYVVSVEIEGNRYDTNHTLLQPGNVHTFKADSSLNVNKFLNIPVTIWVDKDKNIIDIGFGRNIDVKYVYVSAVNGDYNASNSYSGAYIKELAFDDDSKDYAVADGFKVYYNFEETVKPVGIIGNFAKVVFEKNKVMSLELWNLQEGGIIKSIDAEEIVYTRGAVASAKIRDMDNVSKMLFFVDGESVDIRDMKPDSVFSYYKDDENLVVVASQKKVTDVLYSFGNGEVRIGNIFYKMDSAYYSTDGENYSRRSDKPSELLGQMVDAYFDASGKCVYLKVTDSDALMSSKRIGLIVGSEEQIFSERLVSILFLEPTIEKKVVTLSDKVKLEDGLDLTTVLSTVNTRNGELVLEFDIRNDKIVGISVPMSYAGFAEEVRFNGFPNNGAQSMVALDRNYTLSGETQTLYFGDTPLTFLYEKDGVLEARVVPWSQLYNSNSGLGTEIWAKCYGYESSSDMRLALFCGNTGIVSSDNSTAFGLVVGKGTALGSEGETVATLEVLDQNGRKTFTLPEDEAAGIPDCAYIQYFAGGVLKNADEITIRSAVDLSGTVDEMVAAGLRTGEVTRIDDKRVYLESGAVYFLDPVKGCVAYERIQDGRGTQFIAMDLSDIEIGDTIAYYAPSNGILCILVLD